MQSLKEFSIYTKRVLNSRDTFALRENAIALGIDEKVMEENAGYAVASTLRRKYRDEKILFICGTGGKGAAGLSSARHMLNYADVGVTFLGDPEHIHNDSTRFNYKMLSDLMEINCVNADNVDGLEAVIKGSMHVVDAMIGVGIKGRLSGFMTKVIKLVNASGKNIISIDLPTGLDPDTGMQNVASVRPAQLLALHKLKKGAERSKGIESITVVDVGVPLSAELFTGPGDVSIATEPRLQTSNKYTHGNILVIGGSEEYRGAPLLAAFAAENALAALRVGSGYVTVAAPHKIIDICSKISPLIVTRELRGGDKLLDDVPLVKTIKHDVLIVGPGFNQSEVVFKAVAKIAELEKTWGNRMVVDAAAIHALRRYKNVINANMIITPHEGEFKALTGINLKDCTFDERIKKAVNFAKNYSCTLVLKGNQTIITNGDVLKINRARTPVLATMGTGDVLAGIIASYAASHKDVFESAVAGVYVHSKIADLLYASKGMHVIAQDVIDAIPNSLKAFDVMR